MAGNLKGLPPPWSPEYAISLPVLREQLDALTAGGWQVVPLQALGQASPPRASVAVSDDGGSSDLIATAVGTATRSVEHD